MEFEKILAIPGIAALIALVWIFSEDKKNFPWRVVLWGLAIQFSLAIFILNVPIGVTIFQWLGEKVTIFLNYSRESAYFLFGDLIKNDKSEIFGFQFAIILTTTIIFFSSIVSVLYHWGIIQKVVKSIAWIMQKTMGTSGIESLSASANIFVGQTEAPLLIKHYLPYASRSELNSIMTVGFATIAGTVMAAYIQMGIPANLLITAALISAPGSLMLSKVMIPHKKGFEENTSTEDVKIQKEKNVLTAITTGATDGLKLSLNIIAMLIAFIAIIEVVDALFDLVNSWLIPFGVTWFPGSIREFLSIIFRPFAYLVGVPFEEAKIFASLFGTKMSINEFIAFADLGALIESGQISERTKVISTFALCGFANFSSIAIQIGGLGSIAPDRRDEIASLGVKAMLVASLANLLTAAIAGLLL